MAGPMGHGIGPRGAGGFLTEEEKQNKPQITWPLIRRILGYLKPYWKQFVLVFLIILASSVVGLFPSIITGRIVDDALVGRDMVMLVKLLLLALAALAASQIIGVLESHINIGISQRIIFDMKNEMYAHLQSMPSPSSPRRSKGTSSPAWIRTSPASAPSSAGPSPASSPTRRWSSPPWWPCSA